MRTSTANRLCRRTSTRWARRGRATPWTLRRASLPLDEDWVAPDRPARLGRPCGRRAPGPPRVRARRQRAGAGRGARGLEHVTSPMGCLHRAAARSPAATGRPSADRRRARDVRRHPARRAAGRTRRPTARSRRPGTPGGIGWDWDTLLSNRPSTCGCTSRTSAARSAARAAWTPPAAGTPCAVFARALGFVVGKRVAPPAGTTVVLDVTGAAVRSTWLSRSATDGRAAPVRRDPAEPATVALRMDTRDRMSSCAGGRRTAVGRRRRGRRRRRPRPASARRDGRHAVSRGRAVWTPDDIPDLTGRRALVTGVTSGLGEVVVVELARHGAEVVLAARNPAKLAATVAPDRRRRARRGPAPAARRPRGPLVGPPRCGRGGDVRSAAPAGQQRRRDGDAVPPHQSTASSCRWPPTCSGTSR